MPVIGNRYPRWRRNSSDKTYEIVSKAHSSEKPPFSPQIGQIQESAVQAWDKTKVKIPPNWLARFVLNRTRRRLPAGAQTKHE
jgi:hypothetical protein